MRRAPQGTMAAWQEIKLAYADNAAGSPRHVINGSVVANTESAWGVDEWVEKLDQIEADAMYC